ncbi:MAG: glycosyl transferase family 1 [Burkholderiales bacterium PBB1]|nr:MAG: glycosyl transferase family 1 [Burkholderiales bacterium PBB1]
MRRVLFFCEAVTLAHVARPVTLAAALDSSCYEVVIACPDRSRAFAGMGPWPIKSLDSISSERFLAALASGRPVYDLETLRRYVARDIELIDEVGPDVVIGDFRLSLSVSARVAGVPYITMTNAYWSPYYPRIDYPLPVLPMTKLLPLPAAQRLFRWAAPYAMQGHCRPMNRLRREHGLPSLGSDLRRVYTDADHTLYLDFPSLFAAVDPPKNHHFLGPVLWSPPTPEPPWWTNLPQDLPLVYVTMGSSGQAGILKSVLSALAELPVVVMLSTAGAAIPSALPTNAYAAEYLPGIDAAARSNLVVCNGGSPTSQQALAAGVPVLGIASNMDQFMNMEAVTGAGAGLLLRADRLDIHAIRTACRRLLTEPSFRDTAQSLSASTDPAAIQARFNRIVANASSGR